MESVNILHLTLMRRWFYEILSGVKKFEYREIKPYWTKRLFDGEGAVKDYDVIVFKNGYSNGVPEMKVEFKGVEIQKYEGRSVYAISLGRVLSKKNIKNLK